MRSGIFLKHVFVDFIPDDMSVGAKIDHRAPRERRFVAV